MLTTDLIEKQHNLEAEAIALGRERYRKERPMPWRTDTENAAAQEEAALPPGRQLLKRIVGPVAAKIEEAKEAASTGAAGRSSKAMPMLNLMEAEAVAYLTARCAINASAQQTSMRNLANTIAEMLRDHLNYEAIKKEEPAFFRSLMKANKKAGNYGKTWRTKIRRAMKSVEKLLVTWSVTDKIQIGSKCLELLCEAVPDLFVIEREPNSKTGRAELICRPTDKLIDWLERQHARCELLNPIHLPMVTPPQPWTGPRTGAYLSDYQHLIKGAGREALDALEGVEMPDVYAALNAIQSVAWRINPAVLEVMRDVWQGGSTLGGLPRRDDIPLPGKPVDIDTNEVARNDWKRKATAIYQENASAKSKRIGMSQILWIAEKYENERAIYYPHNLDFRGRVYPIPSGGPSPQGDDIQKSLLHFSEGKPLGPSGGRWLAIHIANLFGVDKVSFEERIQWVLDNDALILDSGSNPLDGERFWTQADSPYCALAACMEWVGYRSQGESFVSHLPIALDGSNSGLQHFSAMLRDPEAAAFVNLVPGEKPADIYAEVARKVQAIADSGEMMVIRKKVDGEEVTTEVPNPWAGGKVTRKIAKRPVMTYVYSATRFGMMEMILDELTKLDMELKAEGKEPHLGGFSNYDAATWLSHEMFPAIGMTVSAACGAMDWLKGAASVAAKAGLPIMWTSPIGLPVRQDYRKNSADRVTVYMSGKRVDFVIERPTMELDARGQASAVAPNFVHSCDASHLMRVALACNEAGITSLAVIHDSFGTHACDTETLSMCLRETLIEQYTPSILERLRDQLVEQLPSDVAEELPALPRLGALELADIRHARYAFA